MEEAIELMDDHISVREYREFVRAANCELLPDDEYGRIAARDALTEDRYPTPKTKKQREQAAASPQAAYRLLPSAVKAHSLRCFSFSQRISDSPESLIAPTSGVFVARERGGPPCRERGRSRSGAGKRFSHLCVSVNPTHQGKKEPGGPDRK